MAIAVAMDDVVDVGVVETAVAMDEKAVEGGGSTS